MTNTQKKGVLTAKVVASLSALGILVSVMLQGDTGVGIFMISIFALGLSVMIGIGMSHTPTADDTDRYDFSYVFHRTNFISPWSILITIGSLVWLLISKLRDTSVESALAFFIGFLFLSVIELLYKWTKQGEFDEFRYSFNNHGVTIAKGSWEKELVWHNYKNFITVFKAQKGHILSYIPYLSMFVHESDKYSIVFNRTDEYTEELKAEQPLVDSQPLPTDRIVTMPKNHRLVVKYISKYVSEKK